MLVFFNDAAGELIGRRFEEVGRLERDEWSSEFGPFDEFGKLMPTDEPAADAWRCAKGCPRTTASTSRWPTRSWSRST